MEVIVVKKSQLEDKQKFKELVQKLASFDFNLIIFGLPNSGKSTLVKALCKKTQNVGHYCWRTWRNDQLPINFERSVCRLLMQSVGSLS